MAGQGVTRARKRVAGAIVAAARDSSRACIGYARGASLGSHAMASRCHVAGVPSAFGAAWLPSPRDSSRARVCARLGGAVHGRSARAAMPSTELKAVIVSRSGRTMPARSFFKIMYAVS